jgi:calcineurin-like phosphoesterase family protein
MEWWNTLANLFFTSDTHFGDSDFLTLTRDNGTLLREFPSVEAMDDFIVQQWNSVVRPQDHIYHLGDVAMKRTDIATVGRCNGHKRLIRGNHDIYKTKDYLPFFEEIMGHRKIEYFIFTHAPWHPYCLRHDWINIHGHVHNNVAQGHFGPRYYNISTEVTDYRPLALEELKQMVKPYDAKGTN